MLLEAAADDFEEPDQVRKLLRGLREVRMAKLRSGVELHASSNARIATPTTQITAILAPQETTTTTRWTCNERASLQKPCNLTAYCIITADPHLQHQRLKIARLAHVT